MSPTKTTRKRTTKSASQVFSAEERAAMKEIVAERRRGSNTAAAESDLLAKIAAMKEPDRTMAKRLHALIMAAAPDLEPKTWYGMPAYAKHGDVICFFQDAQKFKSRYATFGFSDKARLDDGNLWPTSFALKELTADAEAKITALVRRAVG